MSRNIMFSFRVTENERWLITALATQLDRTESDAVRWLIREAAREIVLGRGPPNERSREMGGGLSGIKRRLSNEGGGQRKEEPDGGAD